MGHPKEIDVQAELERFEAEERARLGLGEEKPKDHWTDKMTNPQFAASKRAHTELLVSGLTMAHDYIVEGALKGLGYKVRALDCPDYESLRYGKEFGNRAQCNPTYFTVGNIVKELCRLRDEEGLTSQEVIDRYIFVTAGACGPCRFGMYVTEYRKALRDAGFDGFRVMLFQQSGGFEQATGEEAGLKLDPTFFITLAKALLAGDALNALAYRIRPYEVEPGATDRALEEAKKELYRTMEARRSVVGGLLRCREIFSKVKVDRTQAKPKVSIIGEFWAMTTEGDGNYALQRFIEKEGGECDIQLVTAWILYLLWEGRNDVEARAMLRGADKSKYGLEGTDVGVTMATLWLGELLTRGVFHTFAWAIGLRSYKLPDMDAIAKISHDFYNNDLRGGEGHMEVGKLILNVVHSKATMTISVKPFGCMPSSGVSDGVQTVITELHPEAIFCAVETSGDGAVNFHSRVQMFLFKARQRAAQEVEQVLAQYGITREQAQAFLAEHPRYAHPLFKPPHRAAASAADLLHEIGPFVGKSRLEQAKVYAQRTVERAKELATVTVPKKAGYFRKILPYLPSLARKAATEAPKALNLQETWDMLMKKAVEMSEASRRAVAAAEAAAQVPKTTTRPSEDGLVKLGSLRGEAAAAV